MNKHILSFDDISGDLTQYAGGKGGSLARLFQSGFPVPPGYVILPSAFNRDGISSQAWEEFQQYLLPLREADPDLTFAVRSSALSEDSTKASFAGEYQTVLNVSRDEDIHQAIQTVYASRESERVKVYSQFKGKDGSDEIAVVVQRLVKAEASGILFTANPVTGQRDQAMITATWGLGEAIVGGLVTPDTLIIQKGSGRIIKREIGDKQTMTVLLASGTVEKPVPEKMRCAPVLVNGQVRELLQLGEAIQGLYGLPMDIEWVSDGKKIWIVQARPITTLPESEPSAPTHWKMPKGQYAALRNDFVELMPNPLTPLFDTLGRKAINRSLGNLVTYFLGKPGIMPEEIIITVNGYAYNNGSVKPVKLMGIILDMDGILKRMFTGAVDRWTVMARPRYVDLMEKQRNTSCAQLSSTELLNSVRELSEAAFDAYGALISGVIPGAWISEALFTKFYNTFIKRRGDPAAQTFLLGFDNLPIRAEKSLFDLAEWAKSREGLADYLGRTPTHQLADGIMNGSIPPGVDREDWEGWQKRFQEHLLSYGHMIYDFDFITPVLADDPTPLLETCQLMLKGQGANPYLRQLTVTEKRNRGQQDIEKRLKGLRLKYYRKLLSTAQHFAPERENGLADVGMGYPLLRQRLRELGRRFAEAGILDNDTDVFWLTDDEVTTAACRVDKGEGYLSLAEKIITRKATWQAAKRITPPMMLPQMKIFGVDLAELKSGRAHKQKGNLIKGVATSPGTVTAPACVLQGTEDFHKMKAGDVLVAPITTPAWTPLFARAAAVVTDIGGPLSHGSIVAREYGIPAVLGTSVATQRIRNGQMITVDGTRGTVLLS